MTSSERALYDALGDYIDQTYNNATPQKRSAIGFVLTIYQRRLASSFYALQQTLNKRLANMGGVTEEDVSQDETVEDVMDTDEAEALACEAKLTEEERTTIRELLKKLAKIGANTKARTLKTELEAAIADGYDSAIIFTQYSDTMDFLREHLAVEFPGEIVACYSGAGGKVRDKAGFWSDCTKEQIKQRLKANAIRFLVCTDAAAEGLNFQFCGVLVNYDLPWNPMKVEQRIGRIDRIGQRFDTIRVINLAYQDTVEADVYFALGTRINLFQGLVGRLQPILSRLPRQFEQVALEKKEHRDAARHRLLADLEQATREEDRVGLDIDEVAADALSMPQSPAPSLTLSDIDLIFNRADLLLAGAEWRRLDGGSYALRLPGMAEAVRVTTHADVFDDHFESHEFLSPGGRVFDHIATDGALDVYDEPSLGPGKIWLIRNARSGLCRVLARNSHGWVSCDDVATLLAMTDDGSAPTELEESQLKSEDAPYLLA